MTKHAVVRLLAEWNEVPKSVEKIPKKELNELLANFWLNAKKQN